MIHVFRETFPRNRKWALSSSLAIGALSAFMFQALPLVLLLKLPPDTRWALVLLIPALAGVFAVGLAWSHNRTIHNQA